MPNPNLRLAANVEGEFFVDSTCINCDTCRQIAPGTFDEVGEYSAVRNQPRTEVERHAAFQALVACPTASIGAASAAEVKAAAASFPVEVEDGVYYCGFNSEKSFGGNSYFVRHPSGNWMIDAPRYSGHLVRRFEEMGGLRYIFLTHRDDVADAAQYARWFQATRIIHKLELSAQPDAERVIDTTEATELEPDFVALPTPGHTRGHCALLYNQRYLFSGDHLWWSRNRNSLNAGKSVCWYSWPEQTQSMQRLSGYSFEWVLPGHGEKVHLPQAEMQKEMKDLAARMLG